MSEGKSMKSPLIIDVRKQLPWHKRYFSTTTTAVLWACWLFLWRPLLFVIGFIGIQKPHLVNHFFSAFGAVLEHGFSALIGCAIALWLWSNFIPAKTRNQVKAKNLDEYSDYFHINPEKLQQSRQQKIITVHHNADGQITHLQ